MPALGLQCVGLPLHGSREFVVAPTDASHPVPHRDTALMAEIPIGENTVRVGATVRIRYQGALLRQNQCSPVAMHARSFRSPSHDFVHNNTTRLAYVFSTQRTTTRVRAHVLPVHSCSLHVRSHVSNPQSFYPSRAVGRSGATSHSAGM